jgi:hypothetical protein
VNSELTKLEEAAAEAHAQLLKAVKGKISASEANLAAVPRLVAGAYTRSLLSPT